MTTGPVTPTPHSSPARWRLWTAMIAIGVAIGLTATALSSSASMLFGGSATLTAVLLLGAYWIARPWFVARSETCHRVITYVPLTSYALAVALVVLAAASLLPERPIAAGMALVMVWAFHVGGGVTEPRSFPLERLRGRLTWAAALQVFSMCCGTFGTVCIIRALPTPERYGPAVFATSLTVVIGLVAASLKVFTRVRRLATELDRQAQKLERCLDRLSRGAMTDRRMLQDTAEDTWDDLDRTLRNKVETGFHLYGTFVIPSETRKSLESCVKKAIVSPGAPPHSDALEQLGAIRTACRMKIDTLA